MTGLLGNVVLALVWVALTGEFSLSGFVLGLVIGFLVLWVSGELVRSRTYTARVRASLRLARVVLWELVVSNLRVAIETATPGMRATPAIVGVELRANREIEIALISIFISLTPGTVVVHVSDDRSRMYVYGMYVSDPRAFEAELKRKFEDGVLAVTRAGEAIQTRASS